MKELKKYTPRQEIKKLYAALIAESYYEQTGNLQQEKQQVLKQLKDYEGRLSHARNLLATRQIDASDYREMKSDYGEVIARL